jgi:hypothetical protein
MRNLIYELLPSGNSRTWQGFGVFGGNPIGWRELFWNQAKTLYRIILWIQYAGPTVRELFWRQKSFWKTVELTTLPQVFWLLLDPKVARGGLVRPGEKR